MQVLTSLSGLPFSAASAGFAPTNSADVSAIASAYQVVSATATQLNAGTAYLTSVNGAPISASRAGQAANASLASSAYYDGTGRLISALPDSAAVSAIASSYAESAASGKQDELTFGYDANNLISSIDGSALAGQGGGGGGSVASPSGTIIVTDGTAIEGTNSAIGIVPGEPEKFLNLAPSKSEISNWYANVVMGGQSVSGASLMKLQALEYTYNPGAVFTVSISGNPIGGGGEIVGTATASSYGSSMEFDFPLDPSWGFGTIWASANPNTISLDTANVNALTFYSATTASGVKELAWKDELPVLGSGANMVSSINGMPISAKSAGSANYATNAGFSNSASADNLGRPLSELAWASSVPPGITSPSGTIVANRFSIEATNSAVTTALAPGYATTVVGWASQVRPDIPLVCTLPSANEHSKVFFRMNWGSLTGIVSAVYNGITSTATANSLPVDIVFDVPNATSVSLYGSTYRSLIDSASASAADAIVPDEIGELAWASALPTYEYDGDGKISAIDGSALAGGGGGGVDSATVSAIASAYVESGVSSKLDSSASSSFYTTANESGFVDSAYVDSAVSGKLDTTAFNSGDFYSTGNPSGFVDSAYVESSVSGKQDASAMSAYALSSDVSGTVDLVSSQSANWGGSALQLSAGPGVTFTKSGNVLVAGLDETVLWSGEGISAGQSTSLSESITAFERIRVYGHTHNGKAFSWTNEQEALSSQIYGVGLSVWQGSNQELDFSRYSVSGSSISALSGSFIANLNPVGMGNSISWVYKVVGINRTAEA